MLVSEETQVGEEANVQRPLDGLESSQTPVTIAHLSLSGTA